MTNPRIRRALTLTMAVIAWPASVWCLTLAYRNETTGGMVVLMVTGLYLAARGYRLWPYLRTYLRAELEATKQAWRDAAPKAGGKAPPGPAPARRHPSSEYEWEDHGI